MPWDFQTSRSTISRRPLPEISCRPTEYRILQTWQQGIIKSDTGANLNFFHASAKVHNTGPKAVIQINHGMAEHAARYEEFARYLAKRGYAVLIHDHRGHGQTTAPDAPLGSFGGADGKLKIIRDIDTIIQHIDKQYPNVPIVCFGHSMGAIFAMNYTLLYPEHIGGAVIWNTNVETGFALKLFKLILKTERMLKGSDVPSTMATRLTFHAWNRGFLPSRTEFDWLSRDEDEVDKYVNDPLCGFPISVGAWLSVIEAIGFCNDRTAIEGLPKSLPLNLAAGGNDPVSENGETILALGRRLQSAGLKDVSVTIYPQTRHECLHDINREHIAGELADWLDDHFNQR